MLGVAVTVLGPRAVLAAIPLNITGEETDLEFKSSWLLPLLRENIRNTQLAFFTDYFLPLAARCLSRSTQASQAGDTIAQKTYEVLVYQIWALLPGWTIYTWWEGGCNWQSNCCSSSLYISL